MIEADGDTDALPSGIAVLAGPLANGRAVLVFPASFTGAAGGYILATPTDADAANEVAGVWFLDPGRPERLAHAAGVAGRLGVRGLGRDAGTPLSTGRFSDLAAPDTAAPYSGPSAGPPFPGEDFVRNLPVGVTPPVNFADGASVIVISVEPDLGGVDPTGAGPFSVKPLVGAVPRDWPTTR